MKLEDQTALGTATALVLSAAGTRDVEWIDHRARDQHQATMATLLGAPLNAFGIRELDDMQTNAVLLIGLLSELAGAAVLQLRTNVPGFDVDTWLQQFNAIPKET